jgi:rhamnogalacturonyl hydrolase YesR
MIRYAREEQVRLPGVGIFTRTTPVQFTTWVDDMFMGIPFLVQAARYAQNEQLRAELFNDAAQQALAFNSQVWDADAELYMHARYFGNPAKLPHWSRCNGWAIWAMSELLLHLPAAHPLRGPVLEHFRRHAASLARRQAASGFWFNVLDRPDSLPEVSGTAIFVMALARGLRHGWLDAARFRPEVERGWRAVASQIETDGTVHGICMGTMCTEDVEYYVRRPFYDNDTHGLFAVLFAALEVEALQRHRAPNGVHRAPAPQPASA